jgi:predicted secreted protein
MAEKAFGTLLKKGTNTIAELTSIKGIALAADTIDVTTMDDATEGYRKYVQGIRDAGEVEVEGFAKFDDATGQMALLTDFNAGTAGTYSIVFPAGDKWEFTGIVVGFEHEASMEDGIGFSAKLKVSGKPTFTAAI